MDFVKVWTITWIIIFVACISILIISLSYCFVKLGGLKKYWFLIAFSLCGGVLGFIIAPSKIVGKIILGVFFALIALAISAIIRAIFDGLMERFKKKSVNVILTLVEITLCVLLLVFALTRPYGKYHKPVPVYYDEYGKKHYSEKSRDDANFKYYAYKAADEYRKSHPSAK